MQCLVFRVKVQVFFLSDTTSAVNSLGKTVNQNMSSYPYFVGHWQLSEVDEYVIYVVCGQPLAYIHTYSFPVLK
jgi:hypothetical protein